MSILQQLHDSEINTSVSSFYDGVWTAKLGDETNGFTPETSDPTTEAEALAWLDAEARRLFPNSLYATGVYPAGYIGMGDGASADGESEHVRT